MVHVLKRLALLLAVGAALGDVVTMLVAPSFVTWFHTPVGNSALCNCAENARDTASALIDAQLIGTAIGAALLAIIGELVLRLWQARKLRNPPPGPPPSPAQPLPPQPSLSSEEPTQG